MINKKGFTLVELLAVVVVLGIIVGISIPIVNTVISNSKYKSLVVALDEAEKFVGDQWKLKKVDPGSMSDAFGSVIDELESLETNEDFVMLDSSDPEQRELIEEMGFSSEDIKSIIIQVDENDIPCVAIDSLTSNSKLYNTKYWDKIGEEIFWKDSSDNGYYSKCCLGGNVQGYYN